jgi:hypothetical protein
MSTPPRYDQELWVGNHKTLKFRFSAEDESGNRTPTPLAGIRVNVTVFNGSLPLVVKSTATTPTPDVVIGGDDGNEATCVLTPDDTRIIAGSGYAEGESPTYEVEFWDGVELTKLWGRFKLRGGANIDE